MLRKDGRNGDELVAVTLLFAVTFLAAEASTSTSALKWSIGRHMLFLEHLEHTHTYICVCVWQVPVVFDNKDNNKNGI